MDVKAKGDFIYSRQTKWSHTVVKIQYLANRSLKGCGKGQGQKSKTTIMKPGRQEGKHKITLCKVNQKHYAFLSSEM